MSTTVAGVSAAALAGADPTLEAAVRAGLEQVEHSLRAAVESDYPFVTETSRHLLDAGGKRFRSLVVLLAAGAAGAIDAPGVVPAAVAIELTHLSTLYHDDVIDAATLRRGAESANSRWGNTIAVLTGDFLFARASEITADLGAEATRILARTIAVLCQGEIRETVGPGADADAVEHYLRVVAEKTAALVATSARLGARLAGGDEATVALLTRYGDLIGIAFQLSDDLLDVMSDSAESGKTPGTDLREGVRTLPMLLALTADDPGAQRLRQLVEGDLSDPEQLAEAVELLRGHPAVDLARARLSAYAGQARAVLADLPDTPARAALEHLTRYVVERTG